MGKFGNYIASILAISLVPCLLSFAVAQACLGASQNGRSEPKQRSLSQASRARIRQAISAVGLILVRSNGDSPGQSPRPRGSGVVVRSDGIIATNYHVIIDGKGGRLFDEMFFTLSPQTNDSMAEPPRHKITPVLLSKDYDLALLRVVQFPEPGARRSGARQARLVFPSIEIGDSRSIELLEDLTIIGFPEKGGLSVTVNRGVVEGKDLLKQWIKTDARVIHGNSGGAAVDRNGKLIGIPTKVIADSQPIDKNGDGFPDEFRNYGAVGFLRPAHLVAEMLAQVNAGGKSASLAKSAPQTAKPVIMLKVRGFVRVISDRRPIAGALVGLCPTGSKSVTPDTLLSWGGTNAYGQFSLNNAVPPGRYLLRAKALGYHSYESEIEIGRDSEQVTVELRPAAVK